MIILFWVDHSDHEWDSVNYRGQGWDEQVQVKIDDAFYSELSSLGADAKFITSSSSSNFFFSFVPPFAKQVQHWFEAGTAEPTTVMTRWSVVVGNLKRSTLNNSASIAIDHSIMNEDDLRWFLPALAWWLLESLACSSATRAKTPYWILDDCVIPLQCQRESSLSLKPWIKLPGHYISEWLSKKTWMITNLGNELVLFLQSSLCSELSQLFMASTKRCGLSFSFLVNEIGKGVDFHFFCPSSPT